jgi:hypothetical protein
MTFTIISAEEMALEATPQNKWTDLADAVLSTKSGDVVRLEGLSRKESRGAVASVHSKVRRSARPVRLHQRYRQSTSTLYLWLGPKA